MHKLLEKITSSGYLHARWLNTLSFMENAGARKISGCEESLMVDLIQLKHAAEEHRHAYYLKRQIGKLDTPDCRFYRDRDLLAPLCTRQYLHRLDIRSCRYLRSQLHLTGSALKYPAYLFVTHAIEVRADMLYPVYQEVLAAQRSKVSVRSIIAEEEGHLEEMIAQLECFTDDWQLHAARIGEVEQALFSEWIDAVAADVTAYEYGTATVA